MVKSKSSRTPSRYSYHASYLYFSGLSFRKTSVHHLLPFVKMNYGWIWNWIQQRKKPTNLWKKRRKASGFIVDETIIRVGGRELVCLVIACNWTNRGGNYSWHTYFFRKEYLVAAERFLQELIRKYGKYTLLMVWYMVSSTSL